MRAEETRIKNLCPDSVGLSLARIWKIWHGPGPSSYVYHTGRSRTTLNPDTTRIFSNPTYELWRYFQPNLSYLKVWGCLAKVLILDPRRNRIRPKTVDCMFIRYAQNSTAYRFLVLEDKNKVFDLNTIIESKNGELFESIFPKCI